MTGAELPWLHQSAPVPWWTALIIVAAVLLAVIIIGLTAR